MPPSSSDVLAITTWFKADETGTGVRAISGRLSPQGNMLYREDAPRRVTLHNGWFRTWKEAREAQVSRARRRVRDAQAALEAAQAHLREVERLMDREGTLQTL